MDRGILIVISIGVIFLISLFSNDFNKLFTGRATNIEDCKETDSGIDPFVGGTLIGSYDPTKAIKDFCVNTTTLGEYYCDTKKSDGKLKKIYCEFGCITKNGLGECAELPPTRIDCKDSCAYQDQCIPLGFRINGKYCNLNKIMENQKPEGFCNDNYECKTNFCISNKCLTQQQAANFLEDIKTTHFWE